MDRPWLAVSIEDVLTDIALIVIFNLYFVRSLGAVDLRGNALSVRTDKFQVVDPILVVITDFNGGYTFEI